METENRPTVGLADSLTIPGAVIIGTPDPRGKVRAIGVLTRDELQTIVQQAHDVYGITADPFATPGSADVAAERDRCASIAKWYGVPEHAFGATA